MLKISNLSVSIHETKIVHPVSIEYKRGTLNVIVGANGSGKSSLLYSLMGHPAYQIDSGEIWYNDLAVCQLAPDKRARQGFFLALQEPIELPGVSVLAFLHACYPHYQSTAISMSDLARRVEEIALVVGLSGGIVERNVHEGFSGGEKKRFELLQLLLFLPTVVLLDEIDSGLDNNGCKVVASVLEEYRKRVPAGIVLMVTHHMNMLENLAVDSVTVLSRGSIVQSGGRELVEKIGKTQEYETR
jgi:Fe-S cluster assembly ATP-binding protein